MTVVVYFFALIGAWFTFSVTLLGGWVLALNYWRKRASKTARPGASSNDVADGRTLGLVANPCPAESRRPPIPPQEAGTTRPGRAFLKGTK